MSSGKRNATVWHPSVCMSVCLPRRHTVTHQGAACDAASVHFGSTIRTDLQRTCLYWVWTLECQIAAYLSALWCIRSRIIRHPIIFKWSWTWYQPWPSRGFPSWRNTLSFQFLHFLSRIWSLQNLKLQCRRRLGLPWPSNWSWLSCPGLRQVSRQRVVG